MRNNPGANVKTKEINTARYTVTIGDVVKYPFQSRQFRGYCIIYSSSRRSCGDDMSGMGSRKGISPNREAWRRIGPSLIPIRTAPQASRATLDMYRTYSASHRHSTSSQSSREGQHDGVAHAHRVAALELPRQAAAPRRLNQGNSRL